MARPKGANSEQTFERIVNAMNELICEKSPAEVSLRQVARRIDLSVGTIHHYFSSKEELIRACIDRYYARVGAHHSRLLAEAPKLKSPVEVIRLAVGETYRFAFAERAALRMRMSTILPTGTVEADIFTGEQLPFLDWAVAYFQPRTSLSAERIRFATTTIIHLIIRYAISNPEQVRQLLQVRGEEPHTIATAQQRIEAYLVDTALRLFEFAPTDAVEQSSHDDGKANAGQTSASEQQPLDPPSTH